MGAAQPKPMDKSDLRQEIARLEGLLSKDPASSAFHRLADVYTRSGRFVDAIRVCDEGLKHHPHLAEGYVSQGRALFGTGKLNKAIKVLRKAVMLPGSGSEPYRLLGEILLRKDVPTEAVTLLEEAVERGIDERSILSLLERARRAVETEQTSVVEMPGQRGIGNVAIAGTIGATTEIELTPETRRELGRRVRGGKTPPVEKKPRGPVSSPDWSSIDDEWEQELDARNTGTFADLESDVGGPFDRPQLEIQLPPLSDPLTEGMPPLPQDPEDSGASTLPEAAEALRETLPLTDGSAEEEQAKTPELHKASPASPMELADTLLAIVAEPPPGPEQTPPPPPEQDRPGPPPAEVQFEDLIGAAEPESVETEEPFEDDAVPVDIDSLFDDAPAPRRRGRSVWMVIVFLLCSAAGGGGVYLWRRHKGAKATAAALEQGQKARLLGSAFSIERAERAIATARSGPAPGAELAGEAELMAALRWFHFGMGKPVVATPSHSPWSHVLARALTRLASAETGRARSLLEPEPSARSDRAQQKLYLAWTEWTLGDRGPAEQHLGQALELEPALVNALLLRGLMALEIEEVAGAAEACREGLQRSPRHQLLAACVGAALLTQGKGSGDTEERQRELDRLLAMDAEGPVGKAWQEVLRGERKLRDGDLAEGSRQIQGALAAAPPRPALLAHGTRALILAGQLDAAQEAWERLEKVRSSKSLALQLLEARLLLQQGLDEQALARLDGELPAAGRLLRAEALLRRGDLAQVGPALAGLKGPEAGILRAAALALGGLTTPLDTLRELAKTSIQARLFLARALLARNSPKEAAGLVRPLTGTPPVHLEAMTLLAQAQVKARDLGGALATLDGAVRASGSRYLPAVEHQGLVYVALGRFREADTTLTQLSQTGRRSLNVAVALVKARALSGQATEAAVALDEAKKLGASAEQLAALGGFVLLAQGKATEASTALEASSKSGEPDLIDLVALGAAYLKAGKRKGAENTFSRASALDPEHPLPHLWLGRLYLDSGDRRATHEFETAITRVRKRPRFPQSIVTDATVGLVSARLDVGRPSPALVKQLEAAVKAAPAHSEACRLLGKVYIELKRYRAAQNELKRCVEVNPVDATAHYLLGMEAHSRLPQARRALSRFLELEPNGKRATRVRRRLARMR